MVLLQEAVEHVGGEDHRRRHADLDAGVLADDLEVGEQMAHEGQRACFAAQGTVPDAGEAAGGVEAGPAVVAHHRLAQLAPVVVDEAYEVPAGLLVAGEVGRPYRAELLGQREFRPGLEPAGEVVAVRVPGHTLRRNGAQPLHQLLHGAYAGHFGAVRHAKDEIAEIEAVPPCAGGGRSGAWTIP